MRVRRVLPVAASVLVAACGGSDGSGGSVPVVSTAPTPTPSGTPSPAPTPTPSYPVFADLTGAQTFKTVCASLNLNGSPPFPNPTAPFGSGFTLAVPATKDGYRVTGDGLDLAFTAADLDPAAPAGTISYVRRIDGVQTRLTPGTPSAGGAPFDYTRGIALTTPRGGPLVQYLCNYGVPTLATDLPSAASVAYGRVALSGVAYAVTGPGGSPRNYAITASTVTMTLEPARGRVNLRIVLLGNLLSPNGPAATETTALGTYEASAPIDLAAPSFAGTLTSSDRNVQVSTLGGWFFGPQAREAAVPLSLYAIDTATDTRISMVGRVLAAQ